ncbi:hypothetical protein V2A60_008039 [Cordyceps javanica]
MADEVSPQAHKIVQREYEILHAEELEVMALCLNSSLQLNGEEYADFDKRVHNLFCRHAAWREAYQNFRKTQDSDTGKGPGRIATKYSLPDRFWRHAALEPLQFLEQRLPGSGKSMQKLIERSSETLQLYDEADEIIEARGEQISGFESRMKEAFNNTITEI